MNINVHATVSSNSLGYFEYMRANYHALTSRENTLRFFVYCLDRGSAHHLKDDKTIHMVFPLAYGRGSGGHAQAIEHAIKNMVPGEPNIIADTDVVLLLKDWDKLLVDAMIDQKRFGIVGTRLEDIGGFSSGETKYQQYKKKPTTTWMALSGDYDFSGLQVRPDKSNFIEITNDELSALYNLPIGYFVVKDTGWQIPSYLQDRKIPYFALEIVKPTSPQAKALKGTNPYHDEFQWDGVPYLAHQRGSMRHRFRIDPLSVDFYDACDRYLGNPAWSVRPTWSDHLFAKIEDVARAARKLVVAILRPLRGG